MLLQLRTRKHHAFTLIELLIVVAIIAILAAIAVPNFLEAQMRSKVARMQSDMRTMATAIESYHVDNNKYPMDWIERNLAGVPGGERWEYSTLETFIPLTTPIAYLSSVESTRDVFQEQKPFNANLPGTFGYLLWINYWPPASSPDVFNDGQAINREGIPMNWILASFGPDRESSARNMGKPINLWPITGAYDPTNGTISLGDIPRFN
jgi:prepilin-type N-terminal cleavage/methylation domain-containing protein